MKQEQFLNVIDRDEAERRFRAALDLRPLAAEIVPLAEALGRVLRQDVVAPVDVPSFDRSNVDGFALRAEDTFGATEDRPRRLRLSGDVLTARETGVLAALGLSRIEVVRRPRVAIISTGNELIAAGQEMRPGLVYDSNATILADTVRELGGAPVSLGVVADDHDALRQRVRQALECDVVLLSGGTS